MKRVLVISYYWPPSGGSGVQRWVKMCKYLQEFGWQPVVYTPSNPAVTSTDNSLLHDIPWSVEVLKYPIIEPGHLVPRVTSSQVTPINAQKKTFKQKIMMWLRGNCFIPDPRATWVLPSVFFLHKYLEENKIDAIVSTGPPHSMHLIAKRLVAKTGIPWIADFRDPWTRMFYFKHLNLTQMSLKKHIRMEKEVLDTADCIVAVSPRVQEEFRSMTDTRVELVTNGFDEEDFPGYANSMTGSYSSGGNQSFSESRNAFGNGKFTMLHAGLFASDGNPLVLWKVLADMLESEPGFKDDFLLVLCGKTDKEVKNAIVAAGLQDNFDDRGYVTHSNVVEMMRNASVLMLPLRQEPEYKATLPGKIFEYLASRRPILGIGQTDGDAASMLKDTQSGVMIDWDDEESTRKFVEEAYRKFKAGGLKENCSDLSGYTRRNLAERYALLLDEIASKTKHISTTH